MPEFSSSRTPAWETRSTWSCYRGFPYETWVQYVSRRPSPRVDLTPLAADLSGQEEGRGTWEFDGVDQITPSMWLTGAPESRIAPERFIQQVESFLSSAPPAWDPYDSE